MRRVLWFLPAILLLCVPLHAQTPEGKVLLPKMLSHSSAKTQAKTKPQSKGPAFAEWELYGGYSYLRANLNGTGSSFGLNGGTFSLTENLNSWFGGRFEFNAWGGTLKGTNVTAQDFTYGPVFSYRKFQKATLFADTTFGAMHVSRGYMEVSEPDTKFAMTAGGGIDYKMNKWAAIRVQGEYLMTNFLNTRQDNLQVTTGLVIYLGKKKKSTW
jgi:hypothetical protein